MLVYYLTKLDKIYYKRYSTAQRIQEQAYSSLVTYYNLIMLPHGEEAALHEGYFQQSATRDHRRCSEINCLVLYYDTRNESSNAGNGVG
jgi:hypothetical protein